MQQTYSICFCGLNRFDMYLTGKGGHNGLHFLFLFLFFCFSFPATPLFRTMGYLYSIPHHMNTSISGKTNKFEYPLYAVKAQTSLAPLSWFPGSRIPTAPVHQCCRFQSYAKSRKLHAIPYDIYKAWTTFLGSTTTAPQIAACYVWL